MWGRLERVGEWRREADWEVRERSWRGEVGGRGCMVGEGEGGGGMEGRGRGGVDAPGLWADGGVGRGCDAGGAGGREGDQPSVDW